MTTEAIIYIHYGSDQFIPEMFRPVRNNELLAKPMDGGLWASRLNDDYGWDVWCRENRFQTEDLAHSFRFMLSEAKILTLEDQNQLIELPKLKPWKPKNLEWINEIKPGETPSEEQLTELYRSNWCYLDYEKLAEVYDAIELRNSAGFRESLTTWDCDCILVMNAGVVRVVE